MSLNSGRPADWALDIMQRIAELDDPAAYALAQVWWRWPDTGPDAEAALLDVIEMQLSALVERHWGDADELEALQLQLARQDVRQSLVELLRSGASPPPRSPD